MVCNIVAVGIQMDLSVDEVQRNNAIIRGHDNVNGESLAGD